MKIGIVNSKDIIKDGVLTAKHYLDNPDYVTCLICRKVTPLDDVVKYRFCSENCYDRYLERGE